MNLGFHTISLLLHDEMTAMCELGKIGFQHVAIQPRLSGLNPNEDGFDAKLLDIARSSRELGINVIVEAQAPFLNTGSLASEDTDEAQATEDCIQKVMSLASASFLTPEACTVVFETGSSGIDDPSDLHLHESMLERLSQRIDSLLVDAKLLDVRLAVRPKQGNAIAKVTHVQRINQWLSETNRLSIAADTAQMMLAGEFPIGERLAPIASSLACVFLTDPETTTNHEPQPTDEFQLPGRVDLRRVVHALARQEIRVPVIVQIDGQSERGMSIAKEAWDHLS
jgi:hypothetical protein